MSSFSFRPIRRGHSGNSGELGGTQRADIARWSDATLVESMRQGNLIALRAFVDRFRPLLEAYARKTRIPRWEWNSCVTELLDDEAIRFARTAAPLPTNFRGYLMRAVAHRYLYAKRSRASRDKAHVAAAEPRRGETLVLSACSEFSLRASAGPDATHAPPSESLRELVRLLRADLAADDYAILCWLGEGVPNRRIGEWLGISQAAAAKRVWRLRKRLQAKVAEHAATMDAAGRRDVERVLERAGVAVPIELSNAKNGPRTGNTNCPFHQ